MQGESIVVVLQVDHCVGATESWCGSIGRRVGLGLRRATSMERGKHYEERLAR